MRRSLDNCLPVLVPITCVVEIITIHSAGGSRQSSSYWSRWVACNWNVRLLIPCREISFTTMSQNTTGIPSALGVLQSAWGPAAQTQTAQPEWWRKAQWQRRQAQKAQQEVRNVAHTKERNQRAHRSGGRCGEPEVGGRAGGSPGWGGETGGLQSQQAAAVRLPQRGSAERDPCGLTQTVVWGGRGWEDCIWQSWWRNVESYITTGTPYKDVANATIEGTFI